MESASRHAQLIAVCKSKISVVFTIIYFKKNIINLEMWSVKTHACHLAGGNLSYAPRLDYVIEFALIQGVFRETSTAATTKAIDQKNIKRNITGLRCLEILTFIPVMVISVPAIKRVKEVKVILPNMEVLI